MCIYIYIYIYTFMSDSFKQLHKKKQDRNSLETFPLLVNLISSKNKRP